MSSAVSIQGVSKRFAKTLALDEVSFEVPSNSVFGLLGRNGAGKTTLFSIAAGFLKATGGEIKVLDVDVRRIGDLRGRVSMLPQDAQFQGGIPVLDQLMMFSRLAGLDPSAARKASLDALEIVGLADVGTKAARTLSHGMMKRVALCQAFIGAPEVIFLDEPTAGLDPENARNIRNLVRENSENRTVIFSSHNLQEVQDICSHICILDEGKIAEQGTLSDLTNASHLIRVTPNKPLAAEAEAALRAISFVSSIEHTGGDGFNLRLDLPCAGDKDEAMKAIYETLFAHQIYPRSILEGASLESRFLEITGGIYDGASSS